LDDAYIFPIPNNYDIHHLKDIKWTIEFLITSVAMDSSGKYLAATECVGALSTSKDHGAD